MVKNEGFLAVFLVGLLFGTIACTSPEPMQEGESCEKGDRGGGNMFNTCRGNLIRCRSGDEIYVSVELKGRGRVYGAARCAEAVADCTASAWVFADERCSDISRVTGQGDLVCDVSVSSLLGGSPRAYTVRCGVL